MKQPYGLNPSDHPDLTRVCKTCEGMGTVIVECQEAKKDCLSGGGEHELECPCCEGSGGHE